MKAIIERYKKQGFTVKQNETNTSLIVFLTNEVLKKDENGSYIKSSNDNTLVVESGFSFMIWGYLGKNRKYGKARYHVLSGENNQQWVNNQREIIDIIDSYYI